MSRPRAMRPVLITAPTELPVTLAEAKAHLRVETPDEDGLIATLIQAATGLLDGWSGFLGRCLVTQTWSMSFNAFPAGPILLPLAPIVQDPSKVTVKYYDLAGVLQTVNSATYQVGTDELGPFVQMLGGRCWPSTDIRADAVTVQADFGYGTAAAVPAPIKAAILMEVGELYANREGTISNKLIINPTAARMIAPFRRAWL